MTTDKPTDLLSVIEGKKKESKEKMNDPYEIMPARRWWLYHFAGQALTGLIAKNYDRTIGGHCVDAVLFARRLLDQLEQEDDKR